ncbi:hypothetical protein SDC9_116278 [bioreactor metagenome]|uniref:Uncharacterized protein n=1 Tax=bioreactor metagenome TaxID=1076179 RepID=A0A645C1V7_9ZZZZ
MRQRVEQPFRVGMERPGKELFRRGLLHDLPAVYDHGPGTDLADDAEVVRYQHYRGAEFAPELLHQREYLRLYRHVKRRGRLVGDEEHRIAGERHRDHDPLSHASGELVRVFVDTLFGQSDIYHPQHFDRFFPGLFFVHPLMEAEYFHQLFSDRKDRVERGHRLLKDHRYLVSPDGPHLRFAQIQQIGPVKQHSPGDDPGGRLDKPHYGKGRHRLSAAGLADDADDLSFADGEAEITHYRDRLAKG